MNQLKTKATPHMATEPEKSKQMMREIELLFDQKIISIYLFIINYQNFFQSLEEKKTLHPDLKRKMRNSEHNLFFYAYC